MNIFFYSITGKEIPFSELYNDLGSQKEFIISNREEYIKNFANHKERLIDDLVGDGTTVRFIFMPLEVKETFLEWLKECKKVDWHKKESASKPAITQVINADDLMNHFIQEMNVEEEWESVMKPHTPLKEVVRQEDEEQQYMDNSNDQLNVQTNEEKNRIQLDYSNILVIFVFIALLSGAGYQLIESMRNETKENMGTAEESLVKEKYDDANNSAQKVSDSYAKTIAVAITEIEAASKKKESEEITTTPIAPKEHSSPPDEQLLTFLQNANDAFNTARWTTPQNNSVVWWTKKMLEIDPTNTQAKNLLERVIEKYLSLRRYYDQPQQELKPKLNTSVLPQKTQLKDYATDDQRSRITALLGENY